MIASQLLFLFSVLGAVNGFFLALYFFSRRGNRLTNVMLGALLIAVGVRTVKSAFYYFNPDLAVEFLQFGLSACLLIGPLTYLYVRSYLADIKPELADEQWRWHLLLAAIAIGLLALFPYSRYPQAWPYIICAIQVVWFAYLALAGRQLWQSRALLLDDDGRLSRKTILLTSVYLSMALLFIAYATTPLTSYIVGALSFTFSLHVTIVSCFIRSDANEDIGEKEKYQNRKLTEQDAATLLDAINRAMREDQLYLNPNLSLALLAKKVGSLQTTVSQAINQGLDKSFNLYINEFRIQYAKNLLLSESRMNMELVAERSGFNSSSTFFAAFKKIAGQTPASYRASHASAPASSCAAKLPTSSPSRS